MVSSSSIARSKLSFLTSALESVWVFSAILLSRMRPSPGADSKIFMRGYCGGKSPAHQCSHVCCHRLLQALQVVTTLEYRNHAAAGADFGEIEQLPRHPAEILRGEIERRQRIAEMRVEAGGDDD